MTSYPREIFTSWQELVARLVCDASKSSQFDTKSIQELIDRAQCPMLGDPINYHADIEILLVKWARDTFPLYLSPPYSEYNWIPIIQAQINMLNHKQVQLFEDGSDPMAKSDKKPCGCHIDDDPCNPKPCGCDCVTDCDKCVPRLSYPCVKCEIPFFCPQPSMCSDCK